MRIPASYLLLLLVWLVSTGVASGSSVLYEGRDGAERSVSAEFRLEGTDLVVTLTNTSTGDELRPVDVLTAVVFDIEGDPALSCESAGPGPASAVLLAPSSTPDGSPLGEGTVDSDGVVRGEWAYMNSLSGAPGRATQTISSSGLSRVGPSDHFPAANLQGPETRGGLQYGITLAGDDPNSGNALVTGNSGLLQNSVIFTRSELPGGFNLAQISNVFFQDGTDLNEPSFAGTIIPEPGGLCLFGLGGIALAGFGWRQRRRGAVSVCVSHSESTPILPQAP